MAVAGCTGQGIRILSSFLGKKKKKKKKRAPFPPGSALCRCSAVTAVPPSSCARVPDRKKRVRLRRVVGVGVGWGWGDAKA